MIPYVISDDEVYLTQSLIDNIKNGIGRLSGCVSAKVTEELNGEFVADIVIPADALYASNLKRFGLVWMLANDDLGMQLFRVNKITKTLSDGLFNVQLNHITYDLNKLPSMPFTAVGKTALIAAFNNTNLQVTYNPWVYHFVMETTNETSKIEVPIPMPWKSILGGREGSVLDIYGGEWLWDNLSITLKTARGTNRNVVIRYGKNIIDYKQEESIANTYSGCIGYVVKGDNPAVVGNVIYDGDGVDYPLLKVVDLSDKIDEDTTPSVALVSSLTEDWVNANHPKTPSINMDVSFQALKKMKDYETLSALEDIRLGDTVKVRIAGMDVDATAKVTGYVYDVLNEEYEKLTLGNYKNRLADRISNMNGRINNSAISSYPVGSVYQTFSLVNPSALIGGAWTLLSQVDGLYTYRRTG